MKWFADGKKRSKKALEILNALHDSFSDNSDEKPVKDLIAKYISKLKSPRTSVPYILNAFNLEVAKCLRENEIQLSLEQSSRFKQLRELSNIKYGSSM